MNPEHDRETNEDRIYYWLQDNGFDLNDIINATISISVDLELFVAESKEEKEHIHKVIKKLKEVKELINESKV
jgi:hypothetical protein